MPEAGTGFCSRGDCSQAKGGDGLSESQLPLQRAHRPALQMGSLSEFPALRSEPERGVGTFVMPENGI